MKKLILILVCLFVAGCSPAIRFNSFMKNLDAYHDEIDKDASLSLKDKRLLYWAKVKKGAPAEYSGEIDQIIQMVLAVHERQEKGVGTIEDEKTYYEVVKDFWSRVRADVDKDDARAREAAANFAQSLNNQQITAPRNCTTHFIGSTAYTSCY